MRDKISSNNNNLFETISRLDGAIGKLKNSPKYFLDDVKRFIIFIKGVDFKKFKIDPEKSYFKISHGDFEFKLHYSENPDYMILFRYAGMENEFWIFYGNYFTFTNFGGPVQKGIFDFLISNLENTRKLTYRGKYLVSDVLIDTDGKIVSKENCKLSLISSFYYLKKILNVLPPKKVKLVKWA